MADSTETADGAEAAPKSGMMKKVMMGGGVLVLLVGGQFAAPIIKNMLGGGDAAAAGTEAATEVAAKPAPAIYHSLYPPMVANFAGGSHFVKVAIDVTTRKDTVVANLKEHDPAIRNNLILLFKDMDYELTRTRAGIEKLRAAALAEVQAVMTEQTGEPGVEQLYFTTFIVQ